MGSWKICVLLLLASATQSSAFYRKVGLGWFDNWLPEASSFDDSMESTDGFFTFDSPSVCPQNCTCEDIATVPPATTTTTEVTESTPASTPSETNSTTPAEPATTTTPAEPATTTTPAEPATTTTPAEPATTTTPAEPATTTTAESFKKLKGATTPAETATTTTTTPAEPATTTTPTKSTSISTETTTAPSASNTTSSVDDTTTTTAIPETTTAQVCSLTQKCVCFKPVADVETDGFDFEWHNFLYGGLAGVGAIVLLVVLYQLICFKEKKSKGTYEIGMSDYVSDDVA